MAEAPSSGELQAALAERDAELARLRAERAADAAEQERVVERLQRAEAQALDMIRYAPTGIYEVAFPSGRFRTVNDAMCTILGYTREELFAMSAFELLDDEGRRLFGERIRRTLAGEDVDPSVEYRVRTKNGRTIYGVLDTRITYHDGQPDGAFVIAHDVTDRRLAAEELRAQRERLAALAAEQEAVLGSIASGLVVVDAVGRVVRMNAAAERMLGFSPEQRAMTVAERVLLVLRPLAPDGLPYSADSFPALRALRGEVVASQELILHVPARGGSPFHVAISSAPILGPDGDIAGAVSTFTDMEAFHAVNEQLRAAHQAARQSEERQAFLLELSDALRPLSDPVQVQTAACRVLGRRLSSPRVHYFEVEGDELVVRREYSAGPSPLAGRYPLTRFGRDLVAACRRGDALVVDDVDTHPVLSEEDRATFAAIGTRALAGAVLLKEGQWVAGMTVHSERARQWTAEEVSLVEEVAERTWAAVEQARAEDALRRTRDELERRVQERTGELAASREALRAYARQLVEAIEQERTSLARELHDQTSQSMSALKLSLGRLRRAADCGGSHAAQFAEIEELVDSVMDDLHDLAVNLRPASLDRFGLVPALTQLAADFGKQTGLDVGLDTGGAGSEVFRLPGDVETALYRIVQESLSNVARHAAATSVAVIYQQLPGEVQVIVEDNGRGFEVEEALRSGRLGLLGMRERADMLGGTLQIESSPGQGTTVVAAVPIPWAVG